MPQITTPNLKSALIIGENHLIEFKENFTKLDREMVAFANGSGGVIYCGVSDNGKIRGVSTDNKSLSAVQDLARNCDPPIEIIIHRLKDNVVAIEIPEGADKPYQCSSGFFFTNRSQHTKITSSRD